MAGYGDIHGSTSLELFVSIVLQITGVVVFATVVGQFAATISQSRAEEQRCVIRCQGYMCTLHVHSMSEFRKSMQKTDAWMHMRKIPAAIRKRVTTYYTYLWHSEKGTSWCHGVQ